jgi:hypothetical protein
MVTTAAGPQRVSVADGYRLVLESGPGMPFVTLKVERSAPGAFAADRAAVRAQMPTFSDRLGPSDKRLQIITREGVEIVALNEPTTKAAAPSPSTRCSWRRRISWPPHASPTRLTKVAR